VAVEALVAVALEMEGTLQGRWEHQLSVGSYNACYRVLGHTGV
jgi:hypothetical protein